MRKWLDSAVGWVHSHKREIVIAGLAAAVLLLLAFGTKSALYLNFLLGNDIIVKLDADTESVSLVHGQSYNATFRASVTTNPFCSAVCSSTFNDISSNTLVESDEFNLKAGFPIRRSYELEPMPFGEGQRFYRFSMECHSVSTTLCHTDEEPTQRSVLVAVDYGLNEQEKLLKQQSRSSIESIAAGLPALRSLVNASFINEKSLSSVAAVKTNLSMLNSSVQDYSLKLSRLNELWGLQDYMQLSSLSARLEKEVSFSLSQASELDYLLSSQISLYNGLAANLSLARQALVSLTSGYAGDAVASRIASATEDFNIAVEVFNRTSSLGTKQLFVQPAVQNIHALSVKIGRENQDLAIRNSALAALYYGAICRASSMCSSYAFNDSAQIVESCSDISALQAFYANASGEVADYDFTPEFQSNVTAIAFEILSTTGRSLLAEYNQSPAYPVVLPVWNLSAPSHTGEYQDDISPAVVSELASMLPSECSPVIVNATPAFINFSFLETARPVSFAPSSLDEPLPQCPVFGESLPCCIGDECKDKALPVVFLHGHAINKDVSAEYSLDAFNKIQSRLENDGFLNAGVISLYTEQDIPRGVWGRAAVPVTIKASYYFDLFEAPENYIVVQTKSESIDTYAVRLKELLDRIEYRTGKPKVRIVTTSMGGLVARRYIQLFGTGQVDELILLGTPNHGIEGNIAEFCPLVGERLECRDMKSDSLFINKLNREPLPSIPVHNVVGTGCRMGSSIGDGVVLEQNAFLEGASNYVINGTCSRFTPLHTGMLDIDKYPEVYAIILGALSD